MPLSGTIVGRPSAPAVTEVDARWLMAYAAGLGESDECHLDTLRPAGIIAHPLFPVCVEWGTRLSAGELGLTAAEAARGVHHSYDLAWHRPIRPGDRVTTVSEVVAVTRHRAGAHYVTRVDGTVDGEPRWTSWYGTVLREVELAGDEVVLEGAPAEPAAEAPGPALSSATVAVGPTLAHTYSECARIWNPIHTDPAVARAAGLPSIILHGTATLALAVGRVLALAGVDDPGRVRRVAGRFGAMVPMPSALTVRLLARAGEDDGDTLRFDVRTAAGAPAVRDGALVVAP